MGLAAEKYEQVPLPGGSHEALRIDASGRPAHGDRLHTVYWAERSGEILKLHFDSMNLEAYRCSEAEAREEEMGKS